MTRSWTNARDRLALALVPVAAIGAGGASTWKWTLPSPRWPNATAARAGKARSTVGAPLGDEARPSARPAPRCRAAPPGRARARPGRSSSRSSQKCFGLRLVGGDRGVLDQARLERVSSRSSSKRPAARRRAPRVGASSISACQSCCPRSGARAPGKCASTASRLASRHDLETLRVACRSRASHCSSSASARPGSSRARPTAPRDRASAGTSRSVAAVTTPSVPSEPISNCLRSKPRLSFLSGASPSNTLPSGSTASIPSTSARIEPWRSTCVPPALVETSPPIVAEPLPPSVSGKRSPSAAAASCEVWQDHARLGDRQARRRGRSRADRVHPPQREQISADPSSAAWRRRPWSCCRPAAPAGRRARAPWPTISRDLRGRCRARGSAGPRP